MARSWTSAVQVFQSRNIMAALFLGFSSGLPLFLSSKTLQSWLTLSGVSITTVGFLSLVGLPYSLKFLWSPLIDRFVPPFLGRRRGWIFLMQLALSLTLFAMSWQNPQNGLTAIAITAMLMAFFSASQDIAFDAYLTDNLKEREMGAGVAASVLGYRIAMLLSGGVAMIFADILSWPKVYLIMSVIMLINAALTFTAPELDTKAQTPSSLKLAIIMPFKEFFSRKGVKTAFITMAFIVFYKFGDALLGNMTMPFLLKTGFTQTQIGAMQGGVGLAATIVGVFLGGAILAKIGINKAMWIFGILMAASNFMYYFLSFVGQNYWFFASTIIIENLCAGLGTSAFVAFIMRNCKSQYSATQYALLTSLMAVSRDLLVSPAGALATAVGWHSFFLLTIIAGVPGLILLFFIIPWKTSATPIDTESIEAAQGVSL